MIWRLSISAVKIGQVSQSFTCKNCTVSVSTGNISICNVHTGKCKYAPMSVFGDLDHSCLKLFLMFICRLIFFLCFSPKSQRGSKLSSNENFLKGKLLPGHTSFSAPGLASERSRGMSSWENPLINPVFSLV